MNSKLIVCFVFGAGIRYALMLSQFSKSITERIEITTPLNSWKRVKEGAFLLKNNIDPYDGDMFHESPLFLHLFKFLIYSCPSVVNLFFVLCDIITAFFLFKMASLFAEEMCEKQRNDKKYANAIEELKLTPHDRDGVPFMTTVAYLFNPYSVLNCVGQTTTVLSNMFLGGFFWGLTRKNLLMCSVFIALETHKNLYPIVLIIPAALQCSTEVGKRKIISIVKAIGLVATLIAVIFYLECALIGHNRFGDATFGFILTHRDLKPNIGLFWYFFTEMFDHFRKLFLFTFQINAMILYLFPLSIKLYDSPLLLATILTALSSIFRSYPCVGDVAFYVALLPLWKDCAKFMSHNFIVGCFFLVTSVLGPIVWHLWIHINSANANFYFGVTLAFATAQIFLITDLLFSSIKIKFCMKNSMELNKNVVLAKMSLE